MKVIYNGLDPEKFNGYTGDIPRLITVANQVNEPWGKYHGKSNVDIAVKGLPHSYIGNKNEKIDNGIGQTDIFELREMYKHFRAFVYYPERERETAACYENFQGNGCCNAAIEAMMTGMPAILGDFADYKNIIINGVNGFVSDKHEELRDFARVLLNSRSYAKSLGMSARNTMLRYFHIDDCIRKWNNLFFEITR